RNPMPAINPQDMAVLRSLASRGDKMAGILARTLDTLLASDKEVHIARCATTTNLASLSGLSMDPDNVTLVAGDIVFVKSPTDKSENGLYEVSTGDWERVKDDTGRDVLRPGMIVQVTEGDTLADTQWTCTSDQFVVGTDDIEFA